LIPLARQTTPITLSVGIALPRGNCPATVTTCSSSAAADRPTACTVSCSPLKCTPAVCGRWSVGWSWVHGPRVWAHSSSSLGVELHNSCMPTNGPHVFPTSVQPSALPGWSIPNKRDGGLEGRRLPTFPQWSACGRLANRRAETATGVPLS